MNVDDVVAAKVEAARRKAEQQRKDRERRQRARSYGVAARHATKLRHLAEGISNATPAASGI